MISSERLFIGDARDPTAILRRADRFGSRLRGLLGHSALPVDEALWIVPCTSVHTFFMKFPIDVAFLDGEGRIVDRVEHLGAGRLAFARRARSVLEFAAGGWSRMGLSIGQHLQWSSSSAQRRLPLTAAALRH